MKTLIFISAILLSASSFATPILLEKNFTNHAWGYQNHGCLIDLSGYVYKYDVAQKKPISATGAQLTTAELKDVHQLLTEASTGKFSVRHVAADAGALLWSGQNDGREVKLKLWGDYQGVNSAPAARRLVDILDSACGTDR